MPFIIERNSKEYNLINDFMSNHLELMDRYGKPAFIHELVSDKLFINFKMSEILIDIEFFTRFFSAIEGRESDEETRYVDMDSGKQFYYNIRSILEKGNLKYKIYTIDKVVANGQIHDGGRGSESALKDIIGMSDEMAHIKQMVRRVSKSDSTVLITGHTGTGKEMFAHTIHKLSSRAKHSFVVINCGAIPDTLIESELFGYEKGAFTGANQKGKIGKFEQADRGTLFLDEIENMSVFLQMKLLRALEDRSIVRVGGLEAQSVDVRILAATNVDLKEMVERGEFRRDLYYRLNIIQIKIPTLHERGEDVLEISQYFIKQFNQRMKKQIQGLSNEVESLFLKHTWDGNVRELRNVIEYAMNFEDEPVIKVESLPETFFESQETNEHEDVPVFRSLAEIEREEIQKALDYFGWDDKGKQLVAKALNISRSSIYRKVLNKEKYHE